MHLLKRKGGRSQPLWPAWIYIRKMIEQVRQRVETRDPDVTRELRRGGMKEKWGISFVQRWDAGFGGLGIDWAKNTGERGRRSGQWIGILILVEGLATEGELSSAWVRWSSSAQLRRYRWSNLVSNLISRYYCKIIKPGGTEGWQHFGSDQRLEDWGNGEHWCNLPHHFSWQWQ